MSTGRKGGWTQICNTVHDITIGLDSGLFSVNNGMI